MTDHDRQRRGPGPRRRYGGTTVVNTGIICTGGDVNLDNCVVGDHATVVVHTDTDKDQD
jgi:hypothetical protein